MQITIAHGANAEAVERGVRAHFAPFRPEDHGGQIIRQGNTIKVTLGDTAFSTELVRHLEMTEGVTGVIVEAGEVKNYCRMGDD